MTKLEKMMACLIEIINELSNNADAQLKGNINAIVKKHLGTTVDITNSGIKMAISEITEDINIGEFGETTESSTDQGIHGQILQDTNIIINRPQ